MRKIHTIIVFLFVAMLCQAQNTEDSKDSVAVEVAFTTVFPKTSNLTTVQRRELKDKLDAVLARTQTAGSKDTPFIIEPQLTVTGKSTTRTTLEPITLIEGELLLIVKNRYDGKAYNELTIPLRESVSGAKVADPELTLIRSINPKDKRFVGFVHKSVNRIVAYYNNKGSK